MPRVSEIFSSRFLKLNGKPRTITIDGYATEVAFGEEIYVLALREEDRAVLRLSPTCARDIAKAIGDDEMANWVGHQVELFPYEQEITDRDTQMKKMVTIIRARAVPGQPATTTTLAVKPKPTAGRNDLNEEVPF